MSSHPKSPHPNPHFEMSSDDDYVGGSDDDDEYVQGGTGDDDECKPTAVSSMFIL